MSSKNSVFTSFYQTGESSVICSVQLTQRKGNSPAVEIDAPTPFIKPSFIKINTLSTTHSFLIHNIQNGCFTDYINSIALCILEAKIPCEILVSACINSSVMVYSPARNSVEYFYSENISDRQLLTNLKAKCIETYEKLRNEQ
jgi:hypothetical protein